MSPWRASILIVDDDPDIQAVLADRLAALGYRVCIAATGRNGLALLEAEGPQLVLLDLGLPDMHGLDVLMAMRTRVPDVMVVMITAYGTVERLPREKISSHGICHAVGLRIRWLMNFLATCLATLPDHLYVRPTNLQPPSSR